MAGCARTEPIRGLQQTGIAFQAHVPGESKATLAENMDRDGELFWLLSAYYVADSVVRAEDTTAGRPEPSLHMPVDSHH